MTGLVTFPFPLDSGELAYLNLPVDLTKHEAERLGAIGNASDPRQGRVWPLARDRVLRR